MSFETPHSQVGVPGDLLSTIAGWRGEAAAAGRRLRSGDLLSQARDVRADLAALGVGSGDLLLVAAGNHPDALSAVAAAADLGAMAVPMTPLVAPALLKQLIDDAGPVGMVVSQERARAMERVLGTEARPMRGDRLAFVAAPLPRRGAAPPSTLGLVSSGTTGTPKIVVHRPGSALLNARLHACSIGLEAGDRFLMTLPVHFSFGFVACLLGCLVADADILMHEPALTPPVFAALVQASRATVHSATPAMLRRAVGDLPLPGLLRVLSMGGDAPAAGEAERLRARFDGRLHLTYGLSEAGPRAFTREVRLGETGPFDLGTPLKGVEARLGPVPSHREAGAPGREVGELQLASPTAMLGLWGAGGIDRRDFDGGWLRTGDIVERAPDGRLIFRDRLKNIIVSGGEKISSGMIRRVLLDHEDVVAAKIWAEPDPVLGQVPVAAVRLRDDCAGSEAAVLRDIYVWSAKRLRRAELPRRFTSDATLSIALK